MPLATQETNNSPEDFINTIDNESKRIDGLKLLEIMKEVTGWEPKVWGDNFIVGFGKYSYTRKGNKEKFEWFKVGFAPRKTKITVYLTFDIEKETKLLEKLGKHKHGRGCLYLNKLADVDLEILKLLIEKSKKANWQS
jgi:hypothetical protein